MLAGSEYASADLFENSLISGRCGQFLINLQYQLIFVRIRNQKKLDVWIRKYQTILRLVAFTFRSSLLEMFCKKGALKNFAKFTGKHLCQSLIFNKVVDLFRKPFFLEHLRWLLHVVRDESFVLN